MIDLSGLNLSTTTVSELMIDSEKVIHVQLKNPLEHALLVLTKTGYNSVPVLDLQSKFCGIISKSNIIEEMFGVESIEVSRLSELKVEEVMERNIPTLREDDTLEKALHVLINYTFVCVVNEEQKMKGILTRREILKQLRNHFYRQQKVNQ
ncbi:cyclic-di-AMP-binding protein CbpB [Bacillaceae bacterium W0354]